MENKNNCSSCIVFHWRLLYLINKMYVPKEVTKQIVCWRHVQTPYSLMLLSYAWLLYISLQVEVFFAVCLQVEKEKI